MDGCCSMDGIAAAAEEAFARAEGGKQCTKLQSHAGAGTLVSVVSAAVTQYPAAIRSGVLTFTQLFVLPSDDHHHFIAMHPLFAAPPPPHNTPPPPPPHNTINRR